jgi:2-polyprenyl-3-methyl-5-hydroxy-6-metoxy-1,4-benzoquinol methylase
MNKSIKDFYEKQYSYGLMEDCWSKKRAKIALNFIPFGSRILNFGCGVGFESEEFLKVKQYNFVSGCDISENALRCAKYFQDETKQVDLNVVPYPYEDKSFHVIYASEVVEHLFLIEPFLKECYRILKSKGKLILTTNNPAFLRNRINLLFGQCDWTTQQGHLHYYTPSKLKEFLVEEGFKVIRCKNIGNYFFASLGNDYLVVAKKELNKNE